MTSFQKIIKCGAIGFAIYLCFMIIGITLTAITAIFGFSMGIEMIEDKNDNELINKWEQEYSNITSMKIDLSICKLKIKKGNTLKVEAANVSEEFKCKVEENELRIKDEKVYANFFNTQHITPQVTIYIPESMELREINMETGINETNIECLKADTVKLEMGLGKCEIEDLSAKYAKITTGAGETTIQNSKIEELKLEGGIGKLAITSEIMKTADINCGTGRVEMNLVGSSADYKVKAKTGLGSFKVEGTKVGDSEIIGNGETMIRVNAGVGETVVEFIED